MKVARVVHIPVVLTESFEIFLYEVLKYEQPNNSRQTYGNDNIYVLNLDENESMMILLKYSDSAVTTL